MSQTAGDKRVEREAEFSTISGQEIEPLYGPEDVDGDLEERVGAPGSYPFTRGPYESMYRGRLWTMRQFAGFGTVEETNERFHYLLDQGQTGLSTAFDMPTLIVGHPRDPLHPFSDSGMLLEELPNARLVEANSIFEWRLNPERLNDELSAFLDEVWAPKLRAVAAG